MSGRVQNMDTNLAIDEHVIFYGGILLMLKDYTINTIVYEMVRRDVVILTIFPKAYAVTIIFFHGVVENREV